VRRGLVSTREQAQVAVAAGRVLVSGARAEKTSRLVGPAEPVVVTGPAPRFVSRGGEKLDAALDHFGVTVKGKRALDAGASTGGFTDCLLQRGAASVLAVDVGRGQLHERLLTDPRIVRLDRTNIRNLTLAEAGGVPFEVVVADLSFISLKTVAPVLVDQLAAPRAEVLLLVKPQFEAGRPVVAAGRGVVRDPSTWARVLESVSSTLTDHGAAMIGVMVSPVTGADGNVEFLAHLQAHSSPADSRMDIDGVVAEAARLHRVGG
jgi:23S rRNA (cytidine1920-2'-O)/16S rRNA (cytidine1409-2'-O)-methyltransferase